MSKLSSERQASLKRSLQKLTPEDLVFIHDQLASRITDIRAQARDRALKHFRQKSRMSGRHHIKRDTP